MSRSMLAVTSLVIGLMTCPNPASAGNQGPPGSRAPRHHHIIHQRHAAGVPGPLDPTVGAPPAGYDDPRVNNGSFSQFAPNDPERPYGANSTVTAPPGTAGAEEQENNRRYFCNFSPEHC